MTKIFHLSFSVSDLIASRKFYEDICEAQVGRVRDGWLDVWLFGAQITLYHRPAAVIPLPFRHGQHFGATLPLTEWKAFASALDTKNVSFRLAPNYNQTTGVAKMMFEDPDGYLVEVKAYEDPETHLEKPQ
ncbi:MAG: VOC family protein [Litorimonas sp.]